MARVLKGLMRTHHCAELCLSDQGKEVRLCGWVHRIRDLGGLYFIDLRDKFGITQLGFEKISVEDRQAFHGLSLESVIAVRGKLSQNRYQLKIKKWQRGR